MLGQGVAFTDREPGLPEDYDFWRFVQDAPLNSTRLWMLALYAIIRSNGYKDIVEIGVFNGVTSQFLAHAAMVNGGTYHGYDISARNIHEASDRVSRWGVESSFTLCNSQQLALPADRAVDFVFIDAEHTFEACRADFYTWWGLLRVGGTIAIHDVADPELKRFIDTLAHYPAASRMEVISWPGDCGMAFIRRIS